ncbi:MAG: nitroreductase family protein [Spirochaetota bacterium]
MEFSNSLHKIVTKRYSCRTYRQEKLSDSDRLQLETYIDEIPAPPFGNTVRLQLKAASPDDEKSLKNLGTYGVIRNPAGFIIGAVGEGEKNLEDFGFVMEHVILFATHMELGTCWLGGTFSRSAFAGAIALSHDELLPAVVSVGYPAKKKSMMDAMIRFSAGSNRRKPWEELFFDGSFHARLDQAGAGMYVDALEMVRRAPSASNRQPWRVMRDGEGVFHFYLDRTKGYSSSSKKLFGLLDLQRVDMGIAMCHFQRAAAEMNLNGSFIADNEALVPGEHREYVISWKSA